MILHVDAAPERLLGPVAGLVARGRGKGQEEMGLRRDDPRDQIVNYVALPEELDTPGACEFFGAGVAPRTSPTMRVWVAPLAPSAP